MGARAAAGRGSRRVARARGRRREGRRLSTEGGWAVIEAAAHAARASLGARLTAAYAIGSLAHGGFSAAASDVDLALLTEDAVDAGDVRGIAAAAEAAVGTDLSRRLSIFHAPWRAFAAPPPGARFPALDRLDLVRHGVPLGDDVRASLAAPPRAEVVAEAVDYGLERLGSDAVRADVRRAEVGERDLRDVTKLVLFPVRLLFVARTAEVGSNEDAAAHYAAAAGGARLALVDHALAWRQAGAIPDRAGAQALLGDELPALHRQVLGLLARAPGVPRRAAFRDLAATYE